MTPGRIHGRLRIPRRLLGGLKLGCGRKAVFILGAQSRDLSLRKRQRTARLLVREESERIRPNREQRLPAPHAFAREHGNASDVDDGGRRDGSRGPYIRHGGAERSDHCVEGARHGVLRHDRIDDACLASLRVTRGLVGLRLSDRALRRLSLCGRFGTARQQQAHDHQRQGAGRCITDDTHDSASRRSFGRGGPFAAQQGIEADARLGEHQAQRI